MNSGSIANRYADALMRYVTANGSADAVCEQVSALLSAMKRLPKFRSAITDPHALNLQEKLELACALFEPAGKLHPDLVRIFTVMYENGRLELLRLTLLDFLYLYREQHGILHVRVTLPSDSAKVPSLLDDLIRKDFGKEPVIVTRVDPEIIGGFIIESAQYRLDASVRAQLDRSLKLLSRNYKKTV